MSHRPPTTKEKVSDIVQNTVSCLRSSDLEWWKGHCVEPYALTHGKALFFVVAISAEWAIFFSDEDDKFGLGKLNPSKTEIERRNLVEDLPYAVRVLRNRGLPADVIEKVRKDFGEDDALAVLPLLAEYQKEMPLDRILRCIVYAARGNFDRFAEAVALARLDPRDLIVATEYDDDLRKPARDFNKPFPNEL